MIRAMTLMMLECIMGTMGNESDVDRTLVRAEMSSVVLAALVLGVG